VGLDKLSYMDSLFTPDTLEAMCKLRDVFDPSHRANPGKVVPVRYCREWKAPEGRATADDGRQTVASDGEQRTANSVEHPFEAKR